MPMQTGETPMQDYSHKLSLRLQAMAERSGSDTAEMEELTQLVSMATEPPSQSIYQAHLKLMTGLKNLSLITNKHAVQDAFIIASLIAMPDVKMASVRRREGRPEKVIAYVGRYAGR